VTKIHSISLHEASEFGNSTCHVAKITYKKTDNTTVKRCAQHRLKNRKRQELKAKTRNKAAGQQLAGFRVYTAFITKHSHTHHKYTRSSAKTAHFVRCTRVRKKNNQHEREEGNESITAATGFTANRLITQ